MSPVEGSWQGYGVPDELPAVSAQLLPLHGSCRPRGLSPWPPTASSAGLAAGRMRSESGADSSRAKTVKDQAGEGAGGQGLWGAGTGPLL